MTYILAIDQGTTSSRAILFDEGLGPVSQDQQEFAQHFPKSGWVEHDPSDIWRTTLKTCQTALAGIDASKIAAIGITNQRETVVIWDRVTGEPLMNAIVWQDRRTSAQCVRLKGEGVEPLITEKTGLLLDPYFSASKISWVLENVEGARKAANDGRLCFGTIDSFLIWKLTGGKVHATDATNASRTMLFNIRRQEWDRELLDIFGVPLSMMPEVRDSAGDFGRTSSDLFGREIPICGVAGDQQAAAVGQACFRPGMIKSTYGTGCFALLNTGRDIIASKNRLLTTVALRLNGKTTYALEGSIFVAGSAVQWLRDGLGILSEAAQADEMAKAADPAQRLYLVPAFTGLGAPYWDSECRGAMFGLTRASGPAELAKATLESVAYQTRDLYEAMKSDWSDLENAVLRVDGGMAASDWTMQAIADQLAAPVDRPRVTETTALGAAYLAGLAQGICAAPEAFAQQWALEKRFAPSLPEPARQAAYLGWKNAVRRTLGPIS